MKEKMPKGNLVQGNALSVKMHGSVQMGSVVVEQMDGTGVGRVASGNGGMRFQAECGVAGPGGLPLFYGIR